MQLPSLSCLILRSIFIFSALPIIAQSTVVSSSVNTEFDKNETAFFQPFTILHEKNRTALSVAPEAQFLTLDLASLANIGRERPATMFVKLPYKGAQLLIKLVRNEITTSDFSIVTEKNNAPFPYPAGAHYRGYIDGEPTSTAALSFFDDEIMGGINSEKFGNLVLGRLQDRDNQEHYILYADHEMAVQDPFTCGTHEDHEVGTAEKQGSNQPEVNKCVRVFLEADNELFLDKGSSVQSTVNYLLGMFNQAATLYANEQITTVVSQIFVWTTADIYTPTNSATVLNQFKTFRTSFNGDLAHLVGLGGNNLGGIAYVDVLCSSYNYAFSDITTSYSNVPTYSWSVEVFTHEMGHNLGSRHTQWCGWSGGPIDNCVSPEGSCAPGPAPVNGGTIMSYCHLTGNGINFNYGFGLQPGNVVRTETTAASCVSASCPVANCDAPIALTINNITGSGATIGWTATSGATGYALRYRAVGASAWTTINTPTNPYTITGLPANEEVEVAVQSLCGSNASDYRFGILFITGASGGSGGGGSSTCDVPGNLQAIPTANSAQTTWNAVTGASAYNIQWKVSTSSTWSTAVSVSGTNYNVTGLTAGTTYNVRVSAQCSGSTSVFATTTFTTTGSGGGGATCNAPTGLATNPAASSAQATWAAVSGATGYSVQWKVTTAAVWGTAVTTTTAGYTISGLTPATGYDLRVATTCGSTTSPYTTTTFTTPAQGCVPSPNLTTVPSQTTAAVSWINVSGATAYRLEWKLASSGTWANSVDLTATSYTINNLTASTPYHLRISSVCATGVSAATNSLFTTASATATCNGPSGFVASAGVNSAATSWSAVQGATYYRIQWKLTTATNWNPLVSTVNPAYNIQNLVSGSAYNVRVTTLCPTGISPYTTSTFTTASNAASCGTPTNLSATPATQSANTSWTGVNGASGYQIQWKVATSSTWGTPVSLTATNYNITGLTATTNYNLRVAAVCNGVSSAFITTSFITGGSSSCGAPSTMSATPTENSAMVNWNSVSGATGYQIQWKFTSSSTWGTLVNTTGNQYNITGLSASSVYSVRVRTVCNGSSSSFVTGNFTTTGSGGGNPQGCDTPTGLTTTSLSSTTAGIVWSNVGGWSSYAIRIKLTTNNNWFMFSGLPSNVVTIQNLAPSSSYDIQVMANCGNNGSSAFSPTFTFVTPAFFTDPTGDDLIDDRNQSFVKLPYGNQIIEARVVPNPFVEEARLWLEGITEDTPAQITLLNTVGQVVSDRHTTIVGGSVDLDAPALQSGVYFVRIRVGSLIQTVRVVKR